MTRIQKYEEGEFICAGERVYSKEEVKFILKLALVTYNDHIFLSRREKWKFGPNTNNVIQWLNKNKVSLLKEKLPPYLRTKVRKEYFNAI